MNRIVIVGAGVAGLGAAVLLARRGHEVVVCEQETVRTPEEVTDAAEWERPSVPHLRQSHAFLARCREVLRTQLPDVHLALLEAGVREMPLTGHAPTGLGAPAGGGAGEDGLTVLLSRRTTFELVLRRAVLAQPGVTHRHGVTVSGLEVDRDAAVPAVTGVRTEHGEVIRGDLVVDATGRRAPLSAWLRDAGLPDPVEDSEDCGIVYYSRFYQRDPSTPLPRLNRGHTSGGSFDRYSCLVFPGDNDTFSVTFGIVPSDAALKGLRHPAAFQRAAESIPVIADWVDPDRAEPLGPPHAMGGMRNRIRRLVDDGVPLVAGVHPIGDAAGTTNPAHSRGCALALVHAVELADVLDAHHGETSEQTLAMDAALDRELQPWVHDSVAQDRLRLSRWSDRPHEATIDIPEPRLSNSRVFAAAQADAWLWQRFTRTQNLLDPPRAVLDDPRVVRHVEAVESQGAKPAPPTGPSHQELVALLSG